MILKHKIGYLELGLAQVFLAIHIVLAKSLTNIYPVLLLLTIKFSIGFILMASYLWLKHLQEMREQFQQLKTKQWTILILQGLCGGFLFNILNLYGLQNTTATATGIINSTLPAFVAFFSFLILKENLTKRKTMALLLSVIGVLILNVDNSSFTMESTHQLSGLFFVCLAIIPAALFTVLAKMTENFLGPFMLTAFINFLNVLLFLPLTSSQDWNSLLSASLNEWLQILFYGISGGVLFFVFWYRGLRHTTVNIAALFIGIMPIATALLAYTFISESFSVSDAIGMLCVISSIFIGTSFSWKFLLINFKKPYHPMKGNL